MHSAILLLLLLLAVCGLLMLWRRADHRADRAEALRLLALQPVDPPRFAPEMVAGLPEPARRFLTFAIAPGTPLRRVAEFQMQGRFSLGTKAAPRYQAMTATQVLAAPQGFVWKITAGHGLRQLSGSDSGSWTRFWLAGIVPLGRLGGDPDHRRSAFGRGVAEAAFWTPAALLPDTDVIWEAVNADTARYRMRADDLEQAVDVTVDPEGRPLQVSFQRWSNANPERVHRLQPFGGFLSEFREFDGFRVPTHVEAGNHFGTDEYFAFFIADVTALRFPSAHGLP
jgi:hypothetical protein